MTDNSKTTLGLPVKTALAANTDRLMFIWNAANVAAAQTATMTVNNFLNLIAPSTPTTPTTPPIDLPVKTVPAANTDRLVFVWNAANTAAAQTATMTVEDFLNLIPPPTPPPFPTPQHVLIPGGTTGDFDVPGITTGDRIDEVIHYKYSGQNLTEVFDRTSEFTITANDTINNDGGTNSMGKLLVRWTKLT